MKILLITPENPFIKAFRQYQHNNFVQLTMPYLAGFIKPPHTVTLVDEYNQKVNFDVAVDLVGITCNTPNASHVYAMADKFRELGRIVVLGGPHVTLIPQEAKQHADAIVVGEAEETWPAVLADAENGRLEPEYRASQPPDLKGIPFARRDLIYRRSMLKHTIIATRGCPHRCTYCNLRQIYDPSIRYRPVTEVIDEISTFRGPFFTFWDDQLFMNSRFAFDLFKKLAPLKKKWAAMVTLASTKNEKLLKAAAEAGCVCLFLGLESFSSESLKLANKAFNVIGNYREGIERIHRHGITVQAGIVFGFDGDDETTFELTLKGATDAGIDGATVSILTPFPKTPVYENLLANNRLLTQDWSYYNGKTAVTFQPQRMSPEALWEGYMWFRKRFFSLPCTLQRMARSKVRPAQTLFLNWGYHRTISNQLPGYPIPNYTKATTVQKVSV